MYCICIEAIVILCIQRGFLWEIDPSLQIQRVVKINFSKVSIQVLMRQSMSTKLYLDFGDIFWSHHKNQVEFGRCWMSRHYISSGITRISVVIATRGNARILIGVVFHLGYIVYTVNLEFISINRMKSKNLINWYVNEKLVLYRTKWYKT